MAQISASLALTCPKSQSGGIIVFTMYSSTHVATIFHVSTETIRNWSDEFSRYLSFMANPGKGRTRTFSDDDMTVLSLIAEMKGKGSTFEEIHVALGQGQRGDLPDLEVDEVKAIISGDQERRLNLEIEYLKRSLQDAAARAQDRDRLNEENIRLKVQLEATHERVEQLLAQLRSTEATQQKSNAEAIQRVEDLSRQIGESYAKGFIEALERRGDVPKGEG